LTYVLHKTDPLASPTAFPYLVLIPGAWMWFPWTLVTSVFVETNVIQLVFSLIFVAPSLRYLERLWGTYETVKFGLIISAVSNVISLVVNYAEFIAFGRPELFLDMAYYGQMALQTACLVAFTQVIPEHQVQLLGFFKIRVKQLPMLYVGFSNVMCLIGYQSPYILIQWGWLVGWMYLRFFKKTSIENATLAGSVETWGDRSDTFAFVNWFPPFVHGPLGKVCEIVYDLAVRFKLVRPWPPADVETGSYLPLAGGNARAEAERRRAMALKALDQRMATTAVTNNTGNKNQRPPQPSSIPPVQPVAGPSSGQTEPPPPEVPSPSG